MMKLSYDRRKGRKQMAEAVSSKALGQRLIELLRLGPEGVVELQLLRDGSVRAIKLEAIEP